MPEHPEISHEREAHLQAAWSTSYDAWIDVPGAQQPVIYLRPSSSLRLPDDADVQQQQQQQQQQEVQRPAAEEQLPDVALKALFAITAWNGLGQITSFEENAAANARLHTALKALLPGHPLAAPGAAHTLCQLEQPPPPAAALWRGFGFSEGHREDGFVIAFEPEHATAGRQHMLRLALQFRQGAIYAFSALPAPRLADGLTCGPTALLRCTLPAALRHVESAQVVTRCQPPAMDTAHLDWKPHS